MINIKENSFSDLLSLEKITDNEIITPFPVVKKMVELLPEDIFKNPNNKFIDISSKSGIYLKYIFFYLLEKLPNINIDKNNNELDYILDQDYDFKNKEDKKRFILKYMIYGIATSELSFLTSKRTLYENIVENEDTQKEGKILSKPIFDNKDGNIVYKKIKDNQYWFLEEKNEIILKELSKNIKLKKDKKMKFNVIIGNPPYQQNTTANDPKSIYNLFIDKSKAQKPDYISFIIPSRWLNGGNNLNQFRKSMLSDIRLSQIYDYKNEKECFPNVEIKGGVCYFLWDINKKEKYCNYIEIENNNIISSEKRILNQFDIFVRNNVGVKILEKINEKYFLNEIVSSRVPFGIQANFSNYVIKKNEEENIKLYGNKNTIMKNTNGIGYIKKLYIVKNEKLINKHKVLIPKANGNGIDKYILPSKPLYSEPNSICSDTYLVLSYFETKIEAENFIKYVKTKFFRFLVSLRKNTQNTTKSTYSFVPKISMHKEWSDAELYERYNLTEDEINYIENSIKEME